MKGWGALLLLLAALAILFSLLPSLGGGAVSEHPITVAAEGLSFNGTGLGATPYDVLQAVADREGWVLEVQGRGATLIVTAIEGWRNEGAGGWCFAVSHGGWHRPAVSAGAYMLAPGEAVRWQFEPGGCGALGP